MILKHYIIVSITKRMPMKHYNINNCLNYSQHIDTALSITSYLSQINSQFRMPMKH